MDTRAMHETPERSFLDSVEPLRGALRLHCYRMLGSSHDGDDMVQETMLRAWRSRESLEDPAMLRPWLYRIATNACLDELKRRPPRGLASDRFPPADPTAPFAAHIDEPVWLEPMPDAWLASAGASDPSAKYTLKESVALAFVAALHMLSAPQRATLLLRDVVGLSAEETAKALGLSVSAANSALFRARTTVEEKLGGCDVSAFAEPTEIDEALLARYVRAFEESDVTELVALLHDDVKTTMPPRPTWIDGRAANEAFYRHMFETMRGPAGFRLVRTSANGQPAFGFYRAAASNAPPTLHAIQVVTLRDGAIARVDHFMTREVFPSFALPETASRGSGARAAC